MKKFRIWAKFCVKCFLVLLPLWLVWGYVWAFPLNYQNDQHALWIHHETFLDSLAPNQYDVVILGDSTANSAYEPEYMSERVVNLSLTGGSPIDMYHIFCDYLRTHHAPKVCYISFYDSNLYASGLFNNTFFTHIFPWQTEWKILQKGEQYGEKSILTSTAYKDWLSFRLRLPHKYLPTLFNAGFYTRNKANAEAIQIRAKHRGTSWGCRGNENKNYKEQPFTKYTVHPFYDDYYRKIIKKCVENNIKVRILMTPLAPYVKRTDLYQEELHAYYDKLRADYPNVSFFDRMNDFDSRHIQDIDHLNLHGALKFTKAIKRLYPEDFADAANDPVSRNTIDGMTDYLQMENYPGEILRRLEETNFSAVIIRWPGKGGHDEDVLAAVDECYPSMLERAKPLAEKGGTEAAVFFVNGMAKESIVKQNGNDFSLSDNRTQEPLRLHIENNAKATLHLPWQADPLKIDPKLAMDMTVVILNHYDNSIVAVKHFAFSHGSYQLIPEK